MDSPRAPASCTARSTAPQTSAHKAPTGTLLVFDNYRQNLAIMSLSLDLISVGILTLAFFLVRFILHDYLFPLFPSTPLLGPPRSSLLWGQNQFLRSLSPEDVGKVYEEWAEKYGAVFRVPQYLGRSRIVVLDPRAVETFYEGETEVFVGTGVAKRFIGVIVSGFHYLRVTSGCHCMQALSTLD